MHVLIENSKSRFCSILGSSWIFNEDGIFLETKSGNGGITSINDAIKCGALISASQMKKWYVWVMPIESTCYQELAIEKNFSCSDEIDRACVEESIPMKVVFFAQEKATWSSLKSVYETMKNDSRFDVTLVYVQGHRQNNLNKDTNSGILEYADYPIVSEEEYCIEKEKPFIAFYTVPYSFVSEKYRIDYVSKVVPYCIWIPYGFTLESEIPDLVRLRYKIAMQYLAWRVICDDEFGVKLAQKYAWNGGVNFVPLGNPRIDLLRAEQSVSEVAYCEKIRRFANGRKVILWNTHHSISDDCSMFSSWTKFGHTLLDLWDKSKDFFVIWRPHPLFYEALRKYEGDEKYNAIMKRVEEMENVIFDDNPSYLSAFRAADCLLSDASSLLKEFLYIDKPVFWTVAERGQVINDNILKCVVAIDNETQMKQELADLARGEDHKKEYRQQYLQQYTSNGLSIGEKIVNYVYDEILRERTTGCK